MRAGIIGSGNVGQTLARGYSEHAYDVQSEPASPR